MALRAEGQASPTPLRDLPEPEISQRLSINRRGASAHCSLQASSSPSSGPPEAAVASGPSGPRSTTAQEAPPSTAWSPSTAKDPEPRYIFSFWPSSQKHSPGASVQPAKSEPHITALAPTVRAMDMCALLWMPPSAMTGTPYCLANFATW
eukprot:CAMPEP_0195033810 /NCGR_PEP_ID=MMETSP0326_2-20130528/66449_2 /TAXON_ID=2866 ORGANISM="Crypthecodinium cohnii, Strain Seligo" /NCGR_SAMPLE_ID=MMETSP0326_2 /ASSEMBLY_ACC=CAM_ASM_000348 /LENGTH=149 /DNA_ID=CAMNT_0040058395 /DNA_START=223 /DNA_END=671 /DNA_ORIENTATION=-